MKALVIANSILPSDDILEHCRLASDLIICADGGANRAVERGLVPDFVVGDLDSVTVETRAALPETEFIHRPSQYATDLEKTLEFCLQRGMASVLLVGIGGLRLDHQLINFNIAEKFCDRLAMEIHDDHGIGSFIEASRMPVTQKFAGFSGQQVSLIAFRRAEGIRTTGLKYPLNSEALEWAVRDGLSNEAVASEFSIHVETGVVLCYRVRRVPGTIKSTW